MNQILTWAFQITAFLLATGFLQELVPGEENAKYVHFFLGLFFLALVLRPVLSLTGVENPLQEVAAQVSELWNAPASEVSAQELEQQLEQQTVQLAEQKLKEQTEQFLQEQGYEVLHVDVWLEETQGLQIVGTIRKAEQEQKEDSVHIDRVQIGTGENTEGVRQTALEQALFEELQLESGTVILWLHGEGGVSE